MKFETRAIHAGYTPDPTTHAVAVPIYQTTRSGRRCARFVTAAGPADYDGSVQSTTEVQDG